MRSVFGIFAFVALVGCVDAVDTPVSEDRPTTRFVSDDQLNENIVWLNNNELTFLKNGTYQREAYATLHDGKLGTQSGTWQRQADGTICVKETFSSLANMSKNNCYRIQERGGKLQCSVSWGGKRYINAECRLEPLSGAVSRTPTTQNIFSVATGFQAANRGPASAKGVIYYFGGHSPSRPTPINDNIVQPHVISLNKQGWDVFRANPPIKFRNGSSRPLLVENMNRLAVEAKAKGYRKVVFIGQSFGGWNIMRASENAQFDKYIAVAPATFGLAKNARNRSQWESNMLGIVPMGQKSRVPGLVFLFEDDEFYTARVQDGVARANYQNVRVVDRPVGFNGHGAAWLDAFDFVYGDCLARYLASSGTGFSCPKKSLSPRDHRWMTNKSHLEQGGATLVDANSARSILQGNTIAGRAGSDLINVYFANEKQMFVEFRSGYNNGNVQRVPFGLDGPTLCAKSPYFQQNGSSGCYSLYKWPSKNLYIAVAEHGGIVFRGQLLSGNPRNLR